VKPFFRVRSARVIPPIDPQPTEGTLEDVFAKERDAEQERPRRWVVQLDLVTESRRVLQWLLKWAATSGHEPPPEMPDSSPNPDG
jgi:hypothetical protein